MKNITSNSLGIYHFLALATILILSGCSQVARSNAEQTICRELRRDLPTYSTNDTPETLRSGADFIAVFEAICG